jgi:hypothetical protein
VQKDNEQLYHATREEAEKLIKSARSGARFNVMIRVDLPIAGDDEHVFRDGGCASIGVSKKDALRLARELISETLEGRGARLRIRTFEQRDYRYRGGEPNGERKVTVYWIG